MDEERFDPTRHGLDYAAKRLKQISEKDYAGRLARALSRRGDQDTDEQPVPLTPQQSWFAEAQMRSLIREEVGRALHRPVEMVNPHHHRRVELIEENDQRWRGVLYLVEEESEL